MISVFVNAAAVIAGSIIGLLFKKGVPEKITSAVMTAVGLCTAYIGITGIMEENVNALVLILSVVIGAAIGAALDLDGKLNSLGNAVSKKLSRKGTGDSSSNFSQGFVSATLLFCVGAMAIVGSVQAGLTGDNSVIYMKSVLDFISAVMLTITFGGGVMMSAASVFCYQGAIVLAAKALDPIMTPEITSNISCAGSLIIIALSLNLIGVTKIKIANLIPVLIIVPIICAIYLLLNIPL